MKKKFYIIDGHAHIYAAYYAPMRMNLVSKSGEPTKAVYVFTAAMMAMIQKYKPDMIAVAMDSKGKSFRADIYPEYKAHRKPMPEDLPSQIERITKILDAMNITVIKMDRLEADDIIGTLTKKAEKKDCEVLICSKDKDFMQLINDDVKMFDIKNGSCFGEKEMADKMGIKPNQMIDLLALQGDAADNVPGVPDVGPKTAITWLQKYQTMENLYQHENEITGKRGQSLRDNKEQAKLSKELVTIKCDCDIEFDPEKFAAKDINQEKMTKLFDELGFERLKRYLKPEQIQPENLAEKQNNHEADLFGFENVKPNKTQQSSTEENAVNDGLELDSAKTIEHDYQLIDTKEKFDELLKKLKNEKLFAIDTETTSIKAMRAKLVGISIAWQKNKAYYLPIAAPLGCKTLDIDYVRKMLGPILIDEKIKKIGQNFKYDMLVLKNAQMPINGIYFDTMVASYCLNPARRHSMNEMAKDFLNYNCIKISEVIGKGKSQLIFDMVDTEIACEYAAEDADVTYKLYEYLAEKLNQQPSLKKLFENVEMPMVKVLAEMEFNGVSLDRKLFAEMSTELAKEIKRLTDEIYREADAVFNIDSPKQLGEILFDKMNIKTAKKRSTNAAILEKLAIEYPIAKMVLEYRKLAKLQNTYVSKLATLINPITNKIHANFNQTITATGRLSSSSPNLQNIPIRTTIGKKIRNGFVPENKNYFVLSADYSQIELRLLAHLSKDETLKKAFDEDQDIHAFVAAQIYGVEREDVTTEMRSNAKAVNFGIIYGQGAFGLAQQTNMAVGQAKRFIEDYFEKYGSIREFMDNVIETAKKNGWAKTILGRKRPIVNINDRAVAVQKHAERMAVNTVVQGSAADLIKVAMINIQKMIDEQKMPIKMIIQIHDELVFEVPKENVEEYAEFIKKQMASAMNLTVPLKVDVHYGKTWLKN